MRVGSRVLKRVALESLGWLLVIGGLAAIVLPGPGLLAILAGLALLSQQYEWAQRRLEPVKQRALQTAADGVETWPRILASCLGGRVPRRAGHRVGGRTGRPQLVAAARAVVASRRLGHRRVADPVRLDRHGSDRLQLSKLPRDQGNRSDAVSQLISQEVPIRSRYGPLVHPAWCLAGTDARHVRPERPGTFRSSTARHQPRRSRRQSQ
jgi:hypothetical protein